MPYKDPVVRKLKSRDRSRNWRAKRRAAFIADKKCLVCGTTENLEVDHIDPKTKISSAIWTWSKTKLEAELKKCQILCHEHHWEKTRIDNGYGKLVHGTLTCYQKYKCRCEPCRLVWSQHNRRCYLKRKYAK